MGKKFPCVAAVQSFARKEFKIGSYGSLGSRDGVTALARDLHGFLLELERKPSPFLSFFAAFEGPEEMDEEVFEKNLWETLSFLAAEPGYSQVWDPRFSDNPAKENFCFSFAGQAFFVVGLHPQASRPARRFRLPVLVFNSFNQFEMLKARGEYFPMVDVNRARDLKYSGSVNPMAEKYGETREAIQFSGRDNQDAWKCPFRKISSTAQSEYSEQP